MAKAKFVVRKGSRERSRLNHRVDLLTSSEVEVTLVRMATALSAAELGYLRSQRLGRLATIDALGAPQNNPVGFAIDEATGQVLIPCERVEKRRSEAPHRGHCKNEAQRPRGSGGEASDRRRLGEADARQEGERYPRAKISEGESESCAARIVTATSATVAAGTYARRR